MSSESKPIDENTSRSFEVLVGYRYANLSTFRRNGQIVSTPVWFALADHRVYVLTGLRSGKVKRIRANPRVTLTPGDWRGHPRGESVYAIARIMEDTEGETADRVLREKYGWQYGLFHLVQRLRRKPFEHVHLEIRPSTAGSQPRRSGR